MVGKTPDPDEMEELVNEGNPLAVHGFMEALKKAVSDNPEYELIAQMCDVLMFFYEKMVWVRTGQSMILCIIRMFLIRKSMQKQCVR